MCVYSLQTRSNELFVVRWSAVYTHHAVFLVPQPTCPSFPCSFFCSVSAFPPHRPFFFKFSNFLKTFVPFKDSVLVSVSHCTHLHLYYTFQICQLGSPNCLEPAPFFFDVFHCNLSNFFSLFLLLLLYVLIAFPLFDWHHLIEIIF